MKTIHLLLAVILSTALLSGCKASAEETPPAKNQRLPNNYVVVLDLSDRLLAPHQKEQDLLVIKKVFKKFYSDVLSSLIVNSQDRFCVYLLPQKYPAIDYDGYNNDLTLDMRAIPLAEKRKALLTFINGLDEKLERLYHTASAGKHTSDYAGVNIWRFFNEELPYLFDNGSQNHLIIITDGYLDFEKDTQDQLVRNHRYTSTGFLKNLDCNNWKEQAISKDYGILPVDKPHPAISVTVCGFNPKNNSLCETDKLMFFWQKWLKEMNYNNFTLIKKLNSNQLASTLNKIAY